MLALLFLLPISTIAQDPGIIPGDILVMLTPDGSAERIAADLQVVDGIGTGLHVHHEVSAPMRIWLLKFDHESIAQQRMLTAVHQHPHVIMAQNDHPVTFREVPNDPQYGQQWHHQKIQSESAWDHSTGGVTLNGDSIVVCIIEGASLLHPDLVGNRWLNAAEIPNNGIDDDGNGYVDDHRGWNPGSNNDNVYNGGHGTNVAGMIGAKGNNGVGMAGANWDVKMMVVTVGSLTQANVIASYTYPLIMRRRYNDTNGADGAFVVATNASWGIDNGNPANYPLWCAMYDTLGTAGILNCGATANNNVNIDVVGDLPTACPSDFMVSVTATNNNDMRTFSGYGATTIDVGAPGESVWTTSGTNGYTSTSGTSFASPLTAGVIGLLYSAPCPSFMALVQADPMAGALYIREKLFEGVDIAGNLPGNTVTGGRINAGTSMSLIMDECEGCSAPLSPVASPINNNSIEFHWNAFSEGPFTVRYRPAGTTEWIILAGVEEESVSIGDLLPCTAYEFQVGNECDGEGLTYSNSVMYEPSSGVAPVISLDGEPLICVGSSITLVSSSPISNTWSNGEQQPSIEVTQSGSYTVTVDGPCDVLTSEPVEVEVFAPEAPSTSPVVALPGPGTAILTADGENINWYDAPDATTPVGSGSPWETPFLSSNTAFWVSTLSTSDGNELFGGPTEMADIGAYHTNATYYLTFQADMPFYIHSVKVFANGAGSRPIGLIDANGTTVVQGNFIIPNGESRVELGFHVPSAGQYALRVMSGDPQLWRDGIGSGPSYPYSLGMYGAITGTNVTGANANALYYFFYDWEVGEARITCESERQEVLVELAMDVAEMNGASIISTYPNPADKEVVLEIHGIDPRGLQVELMDNTGRRIIVQRITGMYTTIDVGQLAPGPYTHRVLRDGTPIAQGRTVVLH